MVLFFLYTIIILPRSIIQDVTSKIALSDASSSIPVLITNTVVSIPSESATVTQVTSMPTITIPPVPSTISPSPEREVGKVKENGIRIRSKPGSGSTDTQARFNKGIEVTIVGRGRSDLSQPDECPSRDWFRIELPRIGEGWICADFVEIINAAPD
jgi:hypothetical protein